MQKYLTKEKVSWSILGENSENLDELLIAKCDYMISGVPAEDSFPYHSDIIREGKKQDLDLEREDVSLRRLWNRQNGFSYIEIDQADYHGAYGRRGFWLYPGGHDRIKKRWECPACGGSHKRKDLCEKEDERLKLKENISFGTQLGDGGRARPKEGDLNWQELTTQDMIFRYNFERKVLKIDGWHSKLPFAHKDSKDSEAHTV
jgi:hypothetical protein